METTMSDPGIPRMVPFVPHRDPYCEECGIDGEEVEQLKTTVDALRAELKQLREVVENGRSDYPVSDA